MRLKCFFKETLFCIFCNFKINKKYSIEVGGKNKGQEQITGIENAYLALDNLEYGYLNKIPVWLFGMLY